jgi:hypothetical protein
LLAVDSAVVTAVPVGRQEPVEALA